jgi:hypothetical protein
MEATRRGLSLMRSGDPDNTVDRTEAAAKNALLLSWAETVTDTEDEMATQIVTEELLLEVLRAAWRHQFDDDRGPARRLVRDLVGDRVEETLLEGDDE